MNRLRTCSDPAPQNGGNACPGVGVEGESCNQQDCSVPVVPIDGKWSQWSAYGSCSTTCGSGRKVRRRTCTEPKPENAGRKCPGTNLGYQDCNEKPCPGNYLSPSLTFGRIFSKSSNLISVDGKWSVWSNFGTCSKTCGTGERERTRVCSKPAPSNGGKPCPGTPTEKKQCNTKDCPGNETMSYVH